MDKETSAYLDCVRFLAALAVLLCHVDGVLLPDTLNFFDHYGLEAVGVFFVLSGFVIGYVTDTKEKTLKIYAINRAARIYSVVIPCLLLTFVLDSFGRHFCPQFYGKLGSHTHEALQILISFTFLNYTWLWRHPFLPGSDGPFWSLCFEVPYYVAFGLAWFLRGPWRWRAPVVVLAFAGPVAAIMFPGWLAGFGIYRLCRNKRLSRRQGWAILIASILFWATLECLLYLIGGTTGDQGDLNFGFLIIWSGALPFALSILGFRFAGIRIHQYTGPLRWLAGASFTLYLFHFPFSSLMNGLLPFTLPHHLRWIILISTTLGATLILAHFTERRKHLWRNAIESIIARVQASKIVVT